MKTVNEKKAACGYTPKLIPGTCGNCAHFSLDRVLTPWMLESNEKRAMQSPQWRSGEYTAEKHGVEKNLRCTKHGFAVKKMGACNDWQKAEGGVK